MSSAEEIEELFAQGKIDGSEAQLAHDELDLKTKKAGKKRGMEIPDGTVSSQMSKTDVAEEIAKEMGIDTSDGIQHKVEMGKITEINGQAVPEDLQKKSMEMMYPDSGAGQSDHPFLAGADEQGKATTMRETSEQSGTFAYANLNKEQQRVFDEALRKKSKQYREEFKKENEGEEKDRFYNMKLNNQHSRARRDLEGEILKDGGVLGDKEALIQQGAITGDYATGNVKRGYEIDGEEVTAEEYNAKLDRISTSMNHGDGVIDPDTVHVEQGRRHTEFLANRQAEWNAEAAAYEEGRGLSGNTNASVVENATDDANTATAPGATAPVVVQAPAPAPQPQPDINVVVSMPKPIGPETRSGIRMIGMLSNDY